MNRNLMCAAGLAALAMVGAAMGVPAATPLYTFCEAEDNDLCVDSQVLDADLAATYAASEDGRDCFFITGKLQTDCVWGFQPKCAIRAYGKPLQCYDSNRVAIPGEFYEPLLATSDSQGRILNLAPGAGDRTIRLAIAASIDALDGTVNGLNQNSPHDETGDVTVKLEYDGIDDGPFRGDEPDDSYVFKFGGPEGALGIPTDVGGVRGRRFSQSDAVRVAFVIPPGVGTVDVYCCNDTGTQEVCYDVDFYTISSLVPNRSYCVTIIGGMNENGEKPNFALGWFDKQWQLLQCEMSPPTSLGGLKLFGPIMGGRIPFPEDMTPKVGEPEEFVSTFEVMESGRIADVKLTLNIDYPVVSELTVELRHVPSNTVVTVFDRVGVSEMDPDGIQTPLAGEYCFADFFEDDFTEAAAMADGPVPASSYRTVDGFTTLIDLNKRGEWELRVRATPLEEGVRGDDGPPKILRRVVDWSLELLNAPSNSFENLGELCVLSDGEGDLRFGVSGGAPVFNSVRALNLPLGDCNFNGLDDGIEHNYFFFRFLLDINGLVDDEYRMGASTKDASADLVTRYPRAIWEEYLEYFGFDSRIAPEVFFSHGVCAEYCIKVRLAEHVDPSERPTAGTVSGPAMADLNTDDVVNASDLALLLSFWGPVAGQ